MKACDAEIEKSQAALSSIRHGDADNKESEIARITADIDDQIERKHLLYRFWADYVIDVVTVEPIETDDMEDTPSKAADPVSLTT